MSPLSRKRWKDAEIIYFWSHEVWNSMQLLEVLFIMLPKVDYVLITTESDVFFPCSDWLYQCSKKEVIVCNGTVWRQMVLFLCRPCSGNMLQKHRTGSAARNDISIPLSIVPKWHKKNPWAWKENWYGTNKCNKSDFFLWRKFLKMYLFVLIQIGN